MSSRWPAAPVLRAVVPSLGLNDPFLKDTLLGGDATVKSGERTTFAYRGSWASDADGNVTQHVRKSYADSSGRTKTWEERVLGGGKSVRRVVDSEGGVDETTMHNVEDVQVFEDEWGKNALHATDPSPTRDGVDPTEGSSTNAPGAVDAAQSEVAPEAAAAAMSEIGIDAGAAADAAASPPQQRADPFDRMDRFVASVFGPSHPFVADPFFKTGPRSALLGAAEGSTADAVATEAAKADVAKAAAAATAEADASAKTDATAAKADTTSASAEEPAAPDAGVADAGVEAEARCDGTEMAAQADAPPSAADQQATAAPAAATTSTITAPPPSEHMDRLVHSMFGPSHPFLTDPFFRSGARRLRAPAGAGVDARRVARRVDPFEHADQLVRSVFGPSHPFATDPFFNKGVKLQMQRRRLLMRPF